VSNLLQIRRTALSNLPTAMIMGCDSGRTARWTVCTVCLSDESEEKHVGIQSWQQRLGTGNLEVQLMYALYGKPIWTLQKQVCKFVKIITHHHKFALTFDSTRKVSTFWRNRERKLHKWQAVGTDILLPYMRTWPPLWSSGQSSWLQIRRTGFDSRHYQKKK
jgi:hypothetical protein